jgi:hypothetical protein
MKNNSFHLYSQKNHLVFKSAINGSKLAVASTGGHEYFSFLVNKKIMNRHGVVDETLSQGKRFEKKQTQAV